MRINFDQGGGFCREDHPTALHKPERPLVVRPCIRCAPKKSSGKLTDLKAAVSDFVQTERLAQQMDEHGLDAIVARENAMPARRLLSPDGDRTADLAACLKATKLGNGIYCRVDVVTLRNASTYIAPHFP
jgi:hypothetical protein